MFKMARMALMILVGQGVLLSVASGQNNKEMRIIVLDRSDTMSWDLRSGGPSRLSVAKEDILKQWADWSPHGDKANFVVLYFDTSVKEAKSEEEVRGVEASHIPFGEFNHAFYEALELAIRKAWGAAQDKEPCNVTLYFYTDSDLDLPKDTLTRLAKGVAGATNPADETRFINTYNNLVDKGRMRTCFMILDKKGLDNDPKQRSILLGLRAGILSGNRKDMAGVLGWELIRANTSPESIVLGRAEAGKLAQDVEGPTLVFRKVSLPGFIPPKGSLQLSASAPGVSDLVVKPRTVPCATGEERLTLILPKGSTWPSQTNDLVFRVESTSEELAQPAKRKEELARFFEVKYFGSDLRLATPFPAGRVQAISECKDPAEAAWDILHSAALGERAKDFPLEYVLTVEPAFDGGQFEVLRNRARIDAKGSWIPTDAKDAIALRILKGPAAAGTYSFKLALKGRSLDAGAAVSLAEVVVAAAPAPATAPAAVPAAAPPPPARPRIQVSKLKDPAFPQKDSQEPVEFLAFSIKALNGEAVDRLVAVGPAKGVEAASSLTLLADSKEFSLLNGADVAVPNATDKELTCSIRVVAQPGQGREVRFTLPVACDGAALVDAAGKPIEKLEYVGTLPPAPSPRIDLKTLAPTEPNRKRQRGEQVAAAVFSLEGGNAQAAGKRVVVGPVKTEGVTLITFEGHPQEDAREQSIVLRVPSQKDEAEKCIVRFTVDELAKDRIRVVVPVALPEDDKVSEVCVDGVKKEGGRHDFEVVDLVEAIPPRIVFKGNPKFTLTVPYGLEVRCPTPIEASLSGNDGKPVDVKASVAYPNLPDGASVLLDTPQGKVELPGTITLPPDGAVWKMAIRLPTSSAKSAELPRSFGFTLSLEDPSRKYSLEGWNASSRESISTPTIQFSAARPAITLRLKEKGPFVGEGRDVEVRVSKANQVVTQPIYLAMGIPSKQDPAKLDMTKDRFAPELDAFLSERKLESNCETPAADFVKIVWLDDQNRPAGGPLKDWVDSNKPLRMSVSSSRVPKIVTRYPIPANVGEFGGVVRPGRLPTVAKVGWLTGFHILLIVIAVVVVSVLIKLVIGLGGGRKRGLAGFRVEIEDGEQTKTVYLSGRSAVIGSGWLANVKVRAHGVAGSHARIRAPDGPEGEATLAHLAGERFLTVVNGSNVDHEAAGLSDGATIRIGRADSTELVTMTLYWPERQESPAPDEPEPEDAGESSQYEGSG